MSSYNKYQLLAWFPLFLIMGLYALDYLSSGETLLAVVVDTFIYRPILDFRRLHQLGIVNQNGFWKNYFVARFRYAGELMFQKTK